MKCTLPFLLPILGALVVVFMAAPSLTVAGTGSTLKFKGPIGLQLYSLRDQLAKDTPATLDEVKRFNFRNVELAGTYDLTPQDFKRQLAKRGIKAVSGHFPFGQFRTNIAGIVSEAKTLGLDYVGCAWIPHDGNAPFDEKTCRDAAAVFNKAGETLAKNGLKFFYHIHGYEFQPCTNGTLLDLMMAQTNPKFVSFEMDAFWVVHAGQDPVKLLDKYGERWQLMHLKGMKDGTPIGLLTGQSDPANSVPLGTGTIHYPPILRAAQKAGVKWYFIEDESPESETQIPKSLFYLLTVTF